MPLFVTILVVLKQTSKIVNLPFKALGIKERMWKVKDNLQAATRQVHPHCQTSSRKNKLTG